MRKTLRNVITTAVIGFILCIAAEVPEPETYPGFKHVKTESQAELDEQVSDNTRAEFSARFVAPKLLSVQANDETFTQVHVAGTNSVMGEPGNPAVPLYRCMIAAPRESEVTYDFQVFESETIALNLYPVQH